MKRVNRFLITAGLVSGGAAIIVASLTSSASAASASASLAVSATVVKNCTISTGAVGFGSYDPVVANASTDLAGTGSVSVACTKGSTATIGLDPGASFSGGRRMADGAGNFLTYELYQDVNLTTVWGNSGAALLAPAAAVNKNARVFTVYGSVAANQDVPAGAFSDTVVATVNF